MIPVTLRLRNFMCYGDNVQPLSFDGVHVACLCGDNGAGKSSLLDAITWALWGKSRADSDDDLVHQGQTETEVEFDFTAQGQHYRVLRKHKRGTATRSGTTLLSLQSVTDGNSTEISGNTVTETQKKIVELLRLDYKTFRNSAYLVQGKANEFTVADPAERKRVLASILDLSRYDDLCELARAKSASRGVDAARLQGQVEDMDKELAQRATCAADLSALESVLASTVAAREQAEAELARISETLKDLEICQSQLNELAAWRTASEADLAQSSRRAEQVARTVQESETLVAQQEAIETAYAEWVRLDADHARLNEQARSLLSLNATVSRLELAIERAQSVVLHQHDSLQAKLEESRKRASSLDSLETAMAQVRDEIAALASRERGVAERQVESASIAAQVKALTAESEKLNEDATRIDDKLRMLGSQGARCPLCEADLGAHGIERVRATYANDRAELLRRAGENGRQVAALTARRRQIDAELSSAEAAVKKERSDRTSHLGRLATELALAREAAQLALGMAGQLETLQKKLAARDYALNEQTALAQTRDEIARMAYDSAAHERVKKSLQAMAGVASKYTVMQEALKRLPKLREDRDLTEAAITSLRGRLEEAARRAATLAQKTAELPSAKARALAARKDVERLATDEKAHRSQLSMAQERLRRLEQTGKDRAERALELATARDEETIYRQLSDAFGKKGIQALLIEQSLPLVQQEADRLLKRLTDNRMSIAINTQKATKKGGTTETLDIEVGDELGGTRNYEMFSGGEAFRIDFALRIALSRLLTHRAGASLSTLFIDEGFGTQDSTGRDKLVQVINSIQDEFEKIIVITHLEELKDAFPTRIEVSRNPLGSTVTVS